MMSLNRLPAFVTAPLRGVRRLKPKQGAGLFLVALMMVPSSMSVRAIDSGPSAPTSSGGQAPTAANAAISGNTGSFATGVEIDLPPGRMGMSPKLMIGYTSGAGNGPVGVGWNLPMTSVVRMGARKGVPIEAESDEYYLNLNGSGSKLIPVTAYDCSGVDCVRRYHTEIESWTKAEAHWVKQQMIGVWSPDLTLLTYWHVTSKTGMEMDLGTVAGAKTGNFGWYLVRSTDTHGNTIDYTYSAGIKSVGILYYNRIAFTGHVGATTLAPHYFVDFVVEPRVDVSTSLRAGFLQYNADRYHAIYVNDQPVFTPGSSPVLTSYVMEYKDSVKTHRSLLKRIHHYGPAGTAAVEYPSATYSYRDEDQVLQGWEDTSGSAFREGNVFVNVDTAGPNSSGSHDWGARTVDMNADGLTDKIADLFNDTDEAHGYSSEILRSKGTDFTTDIVGGQWTPVIPGQPFAWHEKTGGGVLDMGARIFDINGDGYPDKIDHHGWPDGSRERGVYLGNGARFTTGAAKIFTPDPGSVGANVTRLIPDPGAVVDVSFNSPAGRGSHLPPLICAKLPEICDGRPPSVPPIKLISGPGIDGAPALSSSKRAHFQWTGGYPVVYELDDLDNGGTVIASATTTAALATFKSQLGNQCGNGVLFVGHAARPGSRGVSSPSPRITPQAPSPTPSEEEAAADRLTPCRIETAHAHGMRMNQNR